MTASSTTHTRYTSPSVPEKQAARERAARVRKGEFLQRATPDACFADGERTVLRYGNRIVVLTSGREQNLDLPDLKSARQTFERLRGRSA